MTTTQIKALIRVTALEARIQGMIAENKSRELEGLYLAYTEQEFYDISQEMLDVAISLEDDDEVTEVDFEGIPIPLIR